MVSIKPIYILHIYIYINGLLKTSFYINTLYISGLDNVFDTLMVLDGNM